jgi:hypothetical protein
LSFVGHSLGDVPARLGPRYFKLVNWTRRLRNAKDHAFDCGRSVTGLYPELDNAGGKEPTVQCGPRDD